jgi:hypothetical protein
MSGASELPTPVWSGTFTIWGVELHCHVLDNGQRIIEAADVERLFTAPRGSADDPDLLAFVRWQRGRS